jgi:hypothetical protein
MMAMYSFLWQPIAQNPFSGDTEMTAFHKTVSCVRGPSHPLLGLHFSALVLLSGCVNIQELHPCASQKQLGEMTQTMYAQVNK